MMPDQPQPWIPGPEAHNVPEEHDFWDNLVSAIANRLLGAEQFRRHVRETLGLPSAAKALGKDLSAAEIDKAVKAARPTEGWGGLLGDILATAPAMAIPGGPVVSGVAAGLGSSLSEPVRGGEFFSEKGIQATIGGGIGLAGGVLGKILGQAAKKSPDALNKEVLNVALPPGAKAVTKIGDDGVQQVQQAFNEAYDRVAPRLKLVVDDELKMQLNAIAQTMLGEGATTEEIKQFGNVIKNQIIEPGTRIGLTGDGVNQIQSSLGKLANSSRRADIGYAIKEAQLAVLDAIERSSPEAATELAGLRAKYPVFLAVQQAANSATKEGGIFNLNQLASAVRSHDNAKSQLQQIINTAREKGVGQPTALETLLGPTWFAGPARLATQSPTFRALGKVAEELSTPAVPAIAPTIERGAGALPEPSPEGGGMEFQDFQPPAMPDMDEFIQKNMGAPQSESGEMDNFINKQLRELHIGKLSSAIEEQESGGRNLVSPAGARGPMQIMPSTFRQYAQPGENIDNPWANRQVGKRIISDLYDRYGDPRKVAAAYFSGQPNYRALSSDVTGKQTASYVSDIMRRLQSV